VEDELWGFFELCGDDEADAAGVLFPCEEVVCADKPEAAKTTRRTDEATTRYGTIYIGYSTAITPEWQLKPEKPMAVASSQFPVLS
jgi:hypothetical protein